MEDWQAKAAQLGVAVAGFLAVVALVLLVAERGPRAVRDRLAIALFAGPALVLVGVGLVYPAVRTAVLSLFDADGTSFVGVDNYEWVFTDPQALVTVRNTLVWVVLVPVFATGIGLLYAVLIDRSRFEAVAKSLLFLPMAISFVGASIIWRFVYAYRPPESGQIGLLNQLVVWAGLPPQQFLNDPPWNTFFLVVVMVWIQAGFAMVVLSAAIKAVPAELTEAARLDGASPWQLFRNVTLPCIRPSLVVVLTTVVIGVLKVFDIVRTTTGGQFDTSVLANEMYVQSFTAGEYGRGAALAVLIFVLVVPVVAYNVRQLRRTREVR
ncbi:carbohydrate ABC transporter permease [Motilibacter deserti]|uniref:Sugar ABC transporter permease n=1 Tax=Motilibacter deserti TaxID=2714956 RepID=A0ABX0GWW3_9ACTN|nr:sugar ABC transporter permease [Motilibacter deserti]NHC13743.1 sugar ABC transporter permease [Motilibacter deserti]